MSKNICFELNEEETKVVREFTDKHRKSCPHGSAGDQFEYRFVPTGLGLFTEVECMACHSQINIDCDGEIDYQTKEDKIKKDKIAIIYDKVAELYKRGHDITELLDFLPVLDWALKHEDKYIQINDVFGARKTMETVIENFDHLQSCYKEERKQIAKRIDERVIKISGQLQRKPAK